MTWRRCSWQREIGSKGERRRRETALPDLDRYLASAQRQIADHRGTGYAVRLQNTAEVRRRSTTVSKGENVGALVCSTRHRARIRQEGRPSWPLLSRRYATLETPRW